MTSSENPFTSRRDARTASSTSEEQLYKVLDSRNEIQKLRERRQKDSNKPAPELNVSGLQLIERSEKSFANRFHGGIESSRYITYDIIKQLPPDFFDEYQVEALKIKDAVLTNIIGTGSDLVAEAQQNPTDDNKLTDAYNEVKSAVYKHVQALKTGNLSPKVLIPLVINEILGFGPLDPLWHDRTIDEIFCNGPKDIQVEVAGKIETVPALKFYDEGHLNELIDRLYRSINKQVAVTTPIVDGRLHDNSRLSVVHSSIALGGPNFTIRRHAADYWTPDKLIDFGSTSQEMLREIGNLIYKGCSFLVIGGTGTGKTSTLNALSGFYPDGKRILTLEDNIEMILNPRKLVAAPLETRPAGMGREETSISMQDLVKASLRLKPQIIVIGEVRDHAAYDLVQALNTGHQGASTIHADTSESGMFRVASLISQSGNSTLSGAYPLISTAFDFIIELKQFPDGTRKISAVEEVGARPELGKDNMPFLPTYPLWKFIEEENEDPDDITVRGHYSKVGEFSNYRKELKRLNVTADLSWEQLKAVFELEGSGRR